MDMSDNGRAAHVEQETRQLHEQTEQVRAAMAEVLLEIDDITLQVNPRIESDYAVKIGCYENELAQAQVDARRAKRRVSLAQARVNEGSAIDAAALESTLDEEFAAWEHQLDMQLKSYLQKLEERAETRTLLPHEAKQLASLHRALVKRLHPDLNPGLGEEGTRFFMIAQSAFRNGDVAALKAVDVATQGMGQSRDPVCATPDELYAELELSRAQLHVLEEKLEALKATNPYALRDKLADSSWVCARVESIKRETREQQQAKKRFDERFEQLKGVDGNAR